MTAATKETALLRCPCCHGRKQIMGMGGMKKDCGNCNAIGWVNSVEEESIVITKRAYKRKVETSESRVDTESLQ